MNEEYIRFIKSFLINRCYAEYCELIYSLDNYDISEYKEKLYENTDDIYIWNIIFNRVNSILEYYIKIRDSKEIYPQTKLATVYNQKNIEEYIEHLFYYGDSNSEREYSNYLTNIRRDINEYNKILVKYEKDVILKTVKNNLVYIVNLYIYDKTKTRKIVSNEEKYDMDICINLIPFYEYIGSLGLTLSDIDNDEYINSNNEYKVFQEIKKKCL